ncbi:MAG TPA: monovalent cation/H(+) antiporter subunit G [Thermomicrobiales bacterium]|nr:monovalent cation/H(+) antiporter subunit G [Thermomicrobiales bacterium]
MKDLISDALIIIGLLVMTLGVYGMIRMPDIYTRLHAASKSAFLGVVSLAIAAMLVGDQSAVMRLILLSVLLTLTTPVASHAIGRGAYLHNERMNTPGAIDESGHQLADHDHAEPSWRL